MRNMNYIRSIHPVNGLLLAVSVWAASIAAGAGFVPQATLLGMLSIFLVSGGGFAINHASEERASRGLLAYSIVLMLAGIIISYTINTQTFVISIIIAALMTVYAAKIKKTMIISNLVMAGVAALAFVYGGEIYGIALLPLALLVFLSITGLEIYRAVDDAIGEHKYNEHSVAMKLGVIHTRLLGNMFLTAAVIFSFLPYFIGAGRVYLFFAIIADVFFIVACIAPAKYSSKMIQTGMLLTVIAFIASSV